MGYRWRGYEHPELYKMINAGPGPKASDPQTMYWTSLSEELAQVDQDLNARLTQLGSRWEGKASENAQTGLTPLAEWAGDAETGSTVMKVSSENQGEYIADARAKMPEPIEVTTQAPSGWDKFLAGAAAATGNIGPAADVAAQAADHEAQEAAQSEAEQRAIETMQSYESSSIWNRETLGTFVAPPDVVVATPAPQPTGGVSPVLINNLSVDPGSDPGGGSGGGSGSNPPSVRQQPPNLPPNTGGELVPGTPPPGGGGGGGGGGGTVITNPTNPVGTLPPSVTTPQDVFVPPTTGPNTQFPPPNQFPTNPTPTPNPGGQPPFLGTGPNPFGPGDNASDIARRALPLRPGLPGQGGPFGQHPFGGPGGLPGGGAGAGALDGERAPSQLGRGGLAGGAVGEGGVVRNGPGAAGAAGGRGANGVHGPAGAGGRRADGEDDDEHFAPDYLLENDDVFGDDRRVSPTVIGE
ncbi:hypothetical protein [Actinophytocola algeriensis]|uniref:PPE family protein n=1 Tax=Actinophytocola algeriensis TaxID=1768010 RepID=A0A7W7VDW0_9PSEU|nr:hypothetical protein [Actinophytocola algeriensis]MBB4906494.1 hypothetical protein [Actinophytocola algeriensis]MBE1477975.1 hypothetical protein [Actinophytocola algeriensis]